MGSEAFSEEEIQEFKNEATELLDEAEQHLLSLEGGGSFAKSYDAVFRVFHSLKGAAGMLGISAVASHMHQLESHYQRCKGLDSLSKERMSYFLRGVDAARQLLDGRAVEFEFKLPEGDNPATPQAPSPEVGPDSSSQPAAQPLPQTAFLLQRFIDFFFSHYRDIDSALQARGDETERERFRAQALDLLKARRELAASGWTDSSGTPDSRK